jgi:hypothetical protein
LIIAAFLTVTVLSGLVTLLVRRTPWPDAIGQLSVKQVRHYQLSAISGYGDLRPAIVETANFRVSQMSELKATFKAAFPYEDGWAWQFYTNPSGDVVQAVGYSNDQRISIFPVDYSTLEFEASWHRIAKPFEVAIAKVTNLGRDPFVAVPLQVPPL